MRFLDVCGCGGVVIAVWLFAGHVRAQQSTSGSVVAQPADVPALIAQLAADDHLQRQAAEDGLVAQGPDALPLLRQQMPTISDPEARARLEIVLQRIERNKQFGPTLVTLQLQNVPPQQAYEAILRQVDVTLLPEPDGEAFEDPSPVSISVDREPFWVALAALAKQTGLDVMPPEQHAGGYRLEHTSPSQPRSFSGAALVTCESASRSSAVEHREGAAESSLTMDFLVRVEPKLRLREGAAVDGRIEQILDATGNPIHDLPEPVEAGVEDGMVAFELSLPVARDLGSKLSLLKGLVRVPIVTASKTLAVDDLSKLPGAQLQLDGVPIVLADLQAVGERGHRLTLRARRTGQQEDVWRQWRSTLPAQLRQILLLDAAGRARVAGDVEMEDGEEVADDGDTLDVTLRFPSAEDIADSAPFRPSRLHWEVPVSVDELLVPFEFHDLPIP